MTFSMDGTIDAVVDAMRGKHPENRRNVGGVFEIAVKRIARDHDVRDKLDRQARGPMRYLEQPVVVLPDGLDVEFYGRK